MHLVQTTKPTVKSGRHLEVVPRTGATTKTAQAPEQSANPLLCALNKAHAWLQDSGLLTRSPRPRKHMRVVETLHLGPRRQLMLVSCYGERFLIGTSADAIQSIVRLHPRSAREAQADTHAFDLQALGLQQLGEF